MSKARLQKFNGYRGSGIPAGERRAISTILGKNIFHFLLDFFIDFFSKAWYNWNSAQWAGGNYNILLLLLSIYKNAQKNKWLPTYF